MVRFFRRATLYLKTTIRVGRLQAIRGDALNVNTEVVEDRTNRKNNQLEALEVVWSDKQRRIPNHFSEVLNGTFNASTRFTESVHGRRNVKSCSNNGGIKSDLSIRLEGCLGCGEIEICDFWCLPFPLCTSMTTRTWLSFETDNCRPFLHLEMFKMIIRA